MNAKNYFLLLCCCWLSLSAVKANNVQIVGDIKVLPSSIVNGKIASFDVVVEWENSWRDQFNYDAVYVFLKYRYNETGETWNHLYLGDKENVTVKGTDGATEYDFQLLNSRGTANLNEGILVWRKKIGFGKSSVRLNLKWDITSGDRKLDYAAFNSGKVFLSGMGIEMVYVPQGGFRAGDSQRGNHFHHKYMPIPAAWDIVKEDYRFLTKNNEVNPTNPPQFAANRMNDIDRTLPTNAWLGDKSADQLWSIDFGAGNAKTVRYIAIEGIPGYVPEEWELWGKNQEDGLDATRLLKGVAADWSTDAHCTYPATKALEITKPSAYRFYELRFTKLGAANGPALKTVAMTDVNLKDMYDNSVLITEPQLTLTDQSGLITNHLYTDEEDMQAGTTNLVYPNGYVGFFAMKYEISQEQYVAFLNKLSLPQQVNRTTGERMVALQPGQYVFGETPDAPSFRNGIILSQRRGTTEPLVFANDLNRTNGGYNLDGDGQALACNFLTPGDMLAYADWCGLRPLTELEYEKLCRQPFPVVPLRGEYAWNSTIVTEPTQLTTGTEGTRNEGVATGNVNVGNKLTGPVRCGAFAGSSSTQESAGAGYWGAMELSGNLAEIYYNLNTEGRKFAGILRSSHGNGSILSKTGDSDINAGIWPINGRAFALRGGSFKSTRETLQTSDRSRSIGVYEAGLINVRKEEVTFRLGATLAQNKLVNVLTLQNGQTTTSAAAADTLWNGDDYQILGEIPEEIKNEYYTIAWFVSGDKGNTWEVIEGENSKDLVLKNMRHINVNSPYKEYRYRCDIYSCIAEAKSHQVILRVVNNTVKLVNRSLSLNVANASATISFKSTYSPVVPKWHFKDNPEQDVLFTVVKGSEYLHTPVYKDFEHNGTVQTGQQPLIFRYYYGSYLCPTIDTVWVNVIPTPSVTTNPENVVCGQPFVDARADGSSQIYNTLAIGEQCWMVENMNYAASGSLCYNDDPNNCAKYGRLYNWQQAMGRSDSDVSTPVESAKGICPPGWHIPTNSEWQTMYAAAGSDGKKLKSPYWEVTGNTSGFSALPSGGKFYSYNGSAYSTTAGINVRSGFYDQGDDSKSYSSPRAWWWTSTSCLNERFWSTEYYAYYGNNFVRYIPFYMRLDNAGNLEFNGEAGWRTYGYISNSIFCTNYFTASNNGSYQHLSDAGNNVDALYKMRTQFHMSVRCMRDTLLQDSEK